MTPDQEREGSLAGTPDPPDDPSADGPDLAPEASSEASAVSLDAPTADAEAERASVVDPGIAPTGPANDGDHDRDDELDDPADDGVTAVAAGSVELPVLALVAGRSPDPRVCPFLRLDVDGQLVEPLDDVDPGHQCIAFGEPRPQSARQQDLLCLRPAHANCARYLRGLTVVQPAVAATRSGPPKATVAAVVVLVVSIGVSFGFVLQRGGIDLTAFAVATPGSASPAPTSTSVAATSPTPAPTPGTSPAVTTSPVPTAAVTPSPVVTPSPTPASTPRPTPTPSSTSDRYALLEPCPTTPDCWIYTVRAGDNLFSIANYFGHPLETVYRLNPWTRTRGIRAGDELILPPPTR